MMLIVSSVCGVFFCFLFYFFLQMMMWNQAIAGASRLANVFFFFCPGWVDSDPCPSESEVEGLGRG